MRKKKIVRDNLKGDTRGRVSEAKEYKGSWKKWIGQGVGAHKDRRKKGVNREKRVCKA